MGENLQFNPEENMEQQEQEKRLSFAAAWQTIVLENKTEQPIEFMNDESLKGWLNENLQREAHDLAKTWNLLPEQSVIIQMSKEMDPVAKTQLQKQFVHDLQIKIQKIKDAFYQNEDSSDKWMFFPKIMKEREQFNCSGISLLAEQAFGEAGIETSVGTPTEHVVNVARLANGEIWYLDYQNNKFIDITKHEKVDMSGVPVYKVDQPEIEYQLIPVVPKGHHLAVVLGNLSALNREAQEAESEPDNDSRAAKLDAENFRARYSADFEKTNFREWARRLFPDYDALQDSKEWSDEQERVDGIQGDEYLRETRSFIKGLGLEGEKRLQHELQEKASVFEKLVREHDETLKDRFTPETQKFLSILLPNLSQFREHHELYYKAFVEKMIAKITAGSN